MRMAYDCTSAQPDGFIKYNGGGEYSLRILIEIIQWMDEKTDTITILVSKKKGTNTRIERFCNNNIDCHYYVNYTDLSSYLNGEWDLIFFPICYPEYSLIKIKTGVKVIAGIHDMSIFYHAYLGNQMGRYYKKDGLDWLRKLINGTKKSVELKRYRNMHQKLFRLNDNTHVYTVSYYTKSALECFLRQHLAIDVFYSPLKEDVEVNIKRERELLSSYHVYSGAFFLLSNICRWTKNNMRAILALDVLFTEKKVDNSYKVVLLGCNSRYIKYIKNNINNYDNFIFREFVSTLDLEILYKNAFAFIYPSLLEGFGYPPLEAMKYKTLTLCSSETSIPEVCGNAVIYFNPYNIDSIKMAILRAMDKKYYLSFEQLMQKQYKWIATKQTLDLKRLMEMIFETRGEKQIL